MKISFISQTKHLLIVALSFMGLLLLTGLAQAEVKKPNINIGVFSNYGKVGEDSLKAVELAKNSLHDSAYSYTIHTLNTKFGSTVSHSVMENFVRKNHLSAVISIYTSGGLAIKPIIDENQILQISVASDPKIADGKINFINFSPTQEQINVMIATLKKKNIKTISILHINDIWANAIVKELTHALLKKTSIKILDNKKYSIETKKFSPVIKSMKGGQPNIYFVLGYTRHLQEIISAMRKENIETPITTITTFNPQDDVPFLKGMWYVDTKISPKFSELFKNKTGQFPSTDAAYAYDAFNMIAKAYDTLYAKAKNKNIQPTSITDGHAGAMK